MTREAADVVVVGGGPAGLSAALVLGRAVKRVLVCDAGPRRNAAAAHVHGFLGRDAVPPQELRRIAREEVGPYAVSFAEAGVESIARAARGLEVTLADGSRVATRRALLATGMVDEVPDLPGIQPLWGRTVFPCPYCHGWEHRGAPWGFLGGGIAPPDFATLLTGWAPSVTAFVQGDPRFGPEARRLLEQHRVRLEVRRVTGLVEAEGVLTAVELEDGGRVPLAALVVRPHQRQVPLVARLGLRLDTAGYVAVDAREETSLPGVHAAGDLTGPVQAASLSAAAGARAAFAINRALQDEVP